MEQFINNPGSYYAHRISTSFSIRQMIWNSITAIVMPSAAGKIPGVLGILKKSESEKDSQMKEIQREKDSA